MREYVCSDFGVDTNTYLALSATVMCITHNVPTARVSYALGKYATH